MIAHDSPLARAIRESEAFCRTLKPRLTKYIPNRPTVKQRMAMCMPHVREIMYGGAAGGGKSDWLLMEALQYVDCRDYHARIFRRTLADADNEGSIMFRASEWLAPWVAMGEVRREKGGQRYRFPSGATLSFGGLDQKNDHFKQAGAQYSYLGFDELTQFEPHQFEFVINSRLRKPGCSDHIDTRVKGCDACEKYWHTNAFPLRVRTATNPGGNCHIYVKNRYDIGEIPGYLGPSGEQLFAGRFTSPRPGRNGKMLRPRPHIPAFVHDNPFLDRQAYIEQLQEMSDPVTVAQLLAGNWGITADSRFSRQWIEGKRWRYDGRFAHLDGGHWFELDRCYEFVCIDPATTAKDAPGRKALKGNKLSWTVISRWLVTPEHDLCLCHVDRFQGEMPQIKKGVQRSIVGDRVRFVGMEHTESSKHLYQDLRAAGLPMKAFKTKNKDKISRSYDATTRMEDGKIYLPDPGPIWLQNYEDELFTWTGDEHQTDDQVDVTSYAAIHVTSEAKKVKVGAPRMV